VTRIDRCWPIFLILILLMGAVLRLGSLSVMEFRHDSAYWALDAHRILNNKYLPLVGQQVGSVQTELYNGPILSYITSFIFSLFGYQPRLAAMFIATCNVLGILATFMLGKRLYSRNVGLAAATLTALAPWLVLYGRMLWPQALLPCLIPVSLLTLLFAVENEKTVCYLLYGALLGIGLQLHLSVVALIGTGVLYVLIYSRRKWTVFLVGLGVTVGYAPILLYDISHGLTNIMGLARLPLLHAVDESRIFHAIKTLWNFANVLSGQALWVSKLSDSSYLPALVDWGQGVLLSILFLLGLAMIVFKHSQSKPFKKAIKLPHQDAMLVFFVILPTAYLFLSRSLIQRHYFLFLYPLPFLIVARGIKLWQSHTAPRGLPRSIALIVPIALLVACTFNLVTVFFGYDFLVKSGGEGQYGTILVDKESAVDFILDRSSGHYVVNIENVQETLPYVFLFQVRDDIFVEGEENSALSVRSGSVDGRPHEFRIVEPSYHDLSIADGERVLHRFRGVVVVGQEKDR
jgi:4-amino-4-deoxy-L-arabinose transferase-like glycosyltransferase